MIDWKEYYIERWGCTIHEAHSDQNLYEIEETGSDSTILKIYSLLGVGPEPIKYEFQNLSESKTFAERLIKIDILN
jgi:hypothetical protein